ncbi:MAG: hypothetical protein JXR18_14190 [Neptuniibacter sp.]
MLENLNGEVSVSRVKGKDGDLWVCYEPLGSNESKRQLWKRITGLLTGAEMDVYLGERYHSSELSEKFRHISGR